MRPRAFKPDTWVYVLALSTLDTYLNPLISIYPYVIGDDTNIYL